jgi:hypothetical protein
MSSRRATHPINLEVEVHSQQLPETADGGRRTWLLTLQVALGGQATELGLLADSCDVTGEDLTVSYLGQPDDFSALYKVTEETSTLARESPEVNVRLTPRYHPLTTSVYRLDSRLAALVGRDYLAHPKYALTVILAYARAKRLVTTKTILCDALLEELLGCRWVRHQAVWDKLSALMDRVTGEAVSFQHRLVATDSDQQRRRSAAVVELSADAQRNLYPAKWIYNGLAAAVLERSRTTTEAVAATAVKSKKTALRRHKSI